LPIIYFRPPYGARRPETLRIATRLGMVPVLWNAMTSDWKNPSADAIAHRLINKIDRLYRQGQAANIVLHDGSHSDPAADRAPSVAAAAQLIARYQPTHQFVTLNAWS
jgi:peptidoglycan/xylan/chitin deacetylase (PgdA/CDA1 family)